MSGLFTSLTSAEIQSPVKEGRKQKRLYTEIFSFNYKTGNHSEVKFVFLVEKNIR